MNLAWTHSSAPDAHARPSTEHQNVQGRTSNFEQLSHSRQTRTSRANDGYASRTTLGHAQFPMGEWCWLCSLVLERVCQGSSTATEMVLAGTATPSLQIAQPTAEKTSQLKSLVFLELVSGKSHNLSRVVLCPQHVMLGGTRTV